ncbi:hypothetical protein LC724_05820 [Blautia sp. RD014234]|nr:hypothetical protein [Blautia parvula]
MCTGVLTDSKLAASVEGAGNNTMIGQESGRIHYEKRTAGLLGIFLAAAMMTAACGSDNSQETAEKQRRRQRKRTT